MRENRSATGRLERLALPTVLLAGLALRLWGLRFGLPYLSNFYIRPDETLIVVPALRLFENGGDPGYYVYPSLLMDICAVLFQAFFKAVRLAGLVPDRDILLHFVREPGPYFILARGTSVLAGALTLWIVYLLAARLISRRAGLVAAALLAVAPLAVRDAHFAVTDTLLALFTTAAVYALLLCLDPAHSGFRSVALAGAMIGLAISTKYSGFLLAPAVASVLLLRLRQQRLGKTIIEATVLALVAGCAYLATSPYTVLHLNAAATGLLDTFKGLYGAQPWHEPWKTAAAEQLWRPLCHGPGGIGGILLAVAGLLWPNRNRDQFGIDSRTVIGVTVASFLGVLLLFRDPVPYRYLLPVLPLVAASAASGVLRLHAVFRRRAFTSGLMAVLVLPSLADSVRMDSLLAAKDTRTLAGEWIGKHVPSNVAIVLLGGAECEPQILETPRSLARRIDYVKNLYGRASGTVVAELYQLQARDAVSRNRFGHEVYRNRVPQPLGEDLVLVVSPSYPLPMARYNPGWRTALGGEVAVEVKIRSITAGGSYEFDKSDAFFLPFTRLDEVERPGPNLRLELVRPLGSRLSAGP